MRTLDAGPGEPLRHPIEARGPVTWLLPARDVPLGGPRAMHVRRTLPTRDLPHVGAWCFLDVFGPERTAMRVLPHPHIGLQTVTWVLTGSIRHRDSLGTDVMVQPGQLNLMTAGHGVSHSEMSIEPDEMLHGVQLWVALPTGAQHAPARFEQHRTLPVVTFDGLSATVLVGELDGRTSPARVHTPLLGADVLVAAGRTAALPLRAAFEHAVLALDGEALIDGTVLAPGPLLYLGAGRDRVSISSARGARLLVLGGEPFDDELVMWWNFVGRSHAEIVAARDAWEHDRTVRYGEVAGHGGAFIPAPELPHVRLTPRRRRAT